MNSITNIIKRSSFLGLIFLALSSVSLNAEVLTINTFQPEARPGDNLFVNGLSQQAVLARFGEPLERIAAIGQPPIGRWVYETFTVYFEYDIALHAVVHRERR